MFNQIFLSPQVKRWAIITYKHGIYDLPHELPNDLRRKKLGNISSTLWPIVPGNPPPSPTRHRPLETQPPWQPLHPQDPLHRPSPKWEQWRCQKGQKLTLLDNPLSDLFTEIEIWYLKLFKFVLRRFLER